MQSRHRICSSDPEDSGVGEAGPGVGPPFFYPSITISEVMGTVGRSMADTPQ